MKKILITGGAGFIGSHTADLLLATGYQVVVFDNLASGKLTNLDLFHPRLEFVPGDILDYPKLLTQVKRADAVLHLAAIPSVPKSIENPVQSLQVNMQGFLHVLEAVRYAHKAIRLVYASSAAVYGDANTLPCQDEPAALVQAPLSPYALEKASNERYAQLYADLFALPSLGLRYFNVYGPRQDPASPYSGVIAKFMQNYTQELAITIWGDGLQSRDFIYVADIARANLAALTGTATGALNVATGVPETLLQLAQYIEQAGGKPLAKRFAPARSGDIRQSYAAVTQAQEKLAFTAQITLASGIKLLMT